MRRTQTYTNKNAHNDQKLYKIVNKIQPLRDYQRLTSVQLTKNLLPSTLLTFVMSLQS